MILASADIGAGGTAFLIVLALMAMMALVFWAMIRSFRRLRENTATGSFGQTQKAESAAQTAEVQQAVTHDQTPGGAGV